MADAYGTIKVSFSKDFNGDINKIAEALNKYNLTAEGEFVVYNNEIRLSDYIVQYPTLIPTIGITACIEVVDGYIVKNVDEMTEVDWDNFEGYDEFEEMCEVDFYKVISEFMSSGEIFFSCNCSEGSSYSVSQNLEINFDGTGNHNIFYA